MVGLGLHCSIGLQLRSVAFRFSISFSVSFFFFFFDIVFYLLRLGNEFI